MLYLNCKRIKIAIVTTLYCTIQLCYISWRYKYKIVFKYNLFSNFVLYSAFCQFPQRKMIYVCNFTENQMHMEDGSREFHNMSNKYCFNQRNRYLEWVYKACYKISVEVSFIVRFFLIAFAFHTSRETKSCLFQLKALTRQLKWCYVPYLHIL